jgi:two-component SAPR family response regulator
MNDYRRPYQKMTPELVAMKSQERKLVIVYPSSSQSSIALHLLAESGSDGVLYYRISNDVTTIFDWVEGMVRDFSEEYKKFGTKTRDALGNRQAQQLGQALAADLASIKSDHILLYLDDLDQAAFEDDLNQFMEGLVNAVSDKVRIAVSARMLPRQPWAKWVESGVATVIGIESRRNNLTLSVDAQERPQLEAYAFGKGTVLVNGKPITSWEGTLPRNLTFFLIDNPLVTRDEIFEAFWPDLEVRDATNVFHVTKRKVNERISSRIDGEYELTQYTSGFYVASDRIVRHYDVQEFTEAVEMALIATDENKEMQLYHRAIDLYRAPFLQTIEAAWAVARREELRRMFAVALANMGRIYNRKGDKHRALHYLARAAKEAPEREDVHQEVIELYRSFNMNAEAQRQLEFLFKELKSRSLKPSQKSIALSEAIAE